ncbi:MAG: hypothetical protein CMH56_14640 [Myxococcales bacterium]|nr:hypothetical protein [Myxococcales bacterium]
MPIRHLSRPILALSLCSWVGCGHTKAQETDNRSSRDLLVENRMLQERMRRLEQKVSDLDAQLTVLADRGQQGAADQFEARGGTALAPQPPIRASIDIDVSSETLRTDLDQWERQRHSQMVKSPLAMGGPIENSQTGLSNQVMKIHGKRLGRNSDGEIATPTPIAVSPDTADTVLETKGGYAYMAKPAEQYEWARERLLNHQCERAIPAFKNLMERFPKHDLADNAMYWRAFCFAELGNHKMAKKLWQDFPLTFPRSPKIPDAVYQTATLLEGEGKNKEALTLYRSILKQYPKAEKRKEARAAVRRLGQKSL